MKKLSFVVSLMLAFALSVWAQTPSSSDTQSGTGSSASQGSQSSSGSMSSPSTSTNSQTSGSQGSMSSSSSSSQGSMGQGNTATAEQGKSGKEHKLKGCLESEGGSYVLREKNGKEIALTGSADLAQYANHEVAVRGDWGTGSSAGTSSAASSNTSDMSKGGEKQFTVDKVDSLSDTCKGAKKADKDNKGANSNTNPSSPQ